MGKSGRRDRVEWKRKGRVERVVLPGMRGWVVEMVVVRGGDGRVWDAMKGLVRRFEIVLLGGVVLVTSMLLFNAMPPGLMVPLPPSH